MTDLHVLLVEDEGPKRAHILAFLLSLDVGLSVASAGSVTSAYDQIDAQAPNLLVLDMSLPTFDICAGESGGRPQGFGGIEILRHMVMAGTQCPTIVVTGYEGFPRKDQAPLEIAEIGAQLRTEFPQIFKGILHYNSTFDEWKLRLEGLLAEMGVRRNEGR